MNEEIKRIQQRAELIGLQVKISESNGSRYYSIFTQGQILIKMPESDLTIKTLNAFLHGWAAINEIQTGTVKHESTSFSTKFDFPYNPIAYNLMELVTAKQLGMMRAICREIGIDADEECYDALSCKPDELSKKAASAFITHLQELQKQQEVNR